MQNESTESVPACDKGDSDSSDENYRDARETMAGPSSGPSGLSANRRVFACSSGLFLPMGGG